MKLDIKIGRTESQGKTFYFTTHKNYNEFNFPRETDTCHHTWDELCSFLKYLVDTHGEVKDGE